jgi:hypothetical protein
LSCTHSEVDPAVIGQIELPIRFIGGLTEVIGEHG